MGIFNKKGGKKKVTEEVTPAAHHPMVDDVEYWETIAYGWICDADSAETRELAWARFVETYPEHASEICEDFWRRIHNTHWHRKHHHHHHHHPYCHDDV